MSGYKLTYFNIQARGEVSRILFALADVKYEDNRIEFDDWPSLKKDTLFGQLPQFEGDGMTICQSNTINRYLANKFGFAGTTPQEKARADMIVDCVEDVIKPFLKANFNKDEEAKKEGLKKFQEEELPDYMEKLEKILIQYKEGNSFFVRESITWADVSVYHFLNWLGMWEIKVSFDKFPKLERLVQRVRDHPKVAQWIKDRPETKF